MKRVVSIRRKSLCEEDNPLLEHISLSPAERIVLAWNLTRLACSLRDPSGAEPRLQDILSAFSDSEVEYLLVGAYALSAYGLVRSTGDIDLWVRPTGNNARRVFGALVSFT